MNFQDFIDECDKDDEVNLTDFIVLSDKEILAEYCSPPYRKNSLKLLFSMTKSFSSLAIGIACDKGLLALDDYIIDYFQDELPEEPHENLHKIKVRHLLSMTSGIHENTYADLYPADNWIRAFLAQEFPHEPGKYYRYSTHGSHMLSAIIQRVSGISLEAFLNRYLFYPMDIYEAQWEQSPEGITAGGMGLSLYPSSLAKTAQMLLNGGMYKNIRLLSQEYIDMAASCQSIKQEDINNLEKVYSGYQYGFQFHISSNGCYRADGAFGQLCYLCPRKKIAFIALSQKSKTEKLLKLIDKYFIRSPIETPIGSYNKPASGNRASFESTPVPGRKYRLDSNPLAINFIEFYLDNDNNVMRFVKTDNREYFYKFSFNRLTNGMTYFVKDLKEHYQEYVCEPVQWNDNTLELLVYYIETPYVVHYNIIFSKETLQFVFSINVSMTLNNFSVNGILCSK